jgi:hypothetical protein
MRTGTVTFLTEPEESINRSARIEESKGNYRVVNLNMPYLGTINETWSKATFTKKIQTKEIKVSWHK